MFLLVDEIGNSQRMELEGLKRAIVEVTDDLGCNIDCIVTDRHPSIRKFLKTEKEEIKHYFDAWHIGKGE